MACTDYIPNLERHVLHASGGVLLLLGAPFNAVLTLSLSLVRAQQHLDRSADEIGDLPSSLLLLNQPHFAVPGAMRDTSSDAALQRSACAAIEALSRQSGVPAGLPLIREVRRARH